MATTEANRTSPSKAMEDADAPKEEARGLDVDVNTGNKMTTSCKEDDDGMITGAMMEEEKAMHQQVEQEESEIKKKQDKLWGEMDQADRETRYKRLQFLLKKSNMYTQYLLQRMDAQEEEERKKRERRKKREEKIKMKENTPVPVSSTNTRSGKVSDGDKSIEDTEQKKTSQEEEPNSSSQVAGNKGKGSKVKRKATSPVSPKPAKKKKSELSTTNTANVKLEAQEDDLNSKMEQDSSQEISKESDSQSDNTSLIEKPVLFSGGELRKYQLEGFSWLKTLYENGVNGILADEMGLGKTVQCIALISHIVSMGVLGPFLVCAPLSTLPNWYSEFQRFAPKVPVVLYHGSKDERDRKRVKLRRLMSVTPEVQVYPVVITSYEVTIKDRKLLQNFEWKYLIVDEGHRIKNTQCRLIKELRMYRNTHRLLLTGTPLQNNLSELWSLLNYLLPEIFDDLGSFETWFDVERISSSKAEEKIVQEEEEKNILSMLHQILTPFMLRRLKQDVDLVIPPKKEILVYAPLTELQQSTYKAVVNKTIFSNDEEKKENIQEIEMDENGKPKRRAAKKKINYSLMGDSVETQDDLGKEDEELDEWIQAMAENNTRINEKIEQKAKTTTVNRSLRNIMMQLRKCCNHPYLIDYPLDKDGNYKIDENLVECCGKMKMLDILLKELKKRGHKVLIFSQMTKMLDVIQDYCYLRKHEFCRLDGSFNLEDRQLSIDDFNKYQDVFLFLVSTRAGGLGINLTAADTVIIYDSDWNPQCDLQAQDRCHRIGQTKPVVVYRLVTANTIDQKIVERATAKRRLEKMVIHKGKFKHGIQKFSETTKPLNSKDLLDLLHSKDHEVEIKSQNLSKREIDILIDRSDLWAKFQNVTEQSENKSVKCEKKVSSEAKEIQGVFKVVE